MQSPSKKRLTVRTGHRWAGALALVVLLAGCGSDSKSASSDAALPEKNTVVLRDIAFKAEKVTIPAGETVTWKFKDTGIPHNVVAKDGSFKSDTMDSGTFTHTFTAPGTYEYQCTLHPAQMNGSVVVK